MKAIDFEKKLIQAIDDVVTSIIMQNIKLNISARSRAGAEISDFLEEEFVKTTQSNSNILNSQSSPKGKTKNPWDARCEYTCNSIREEIWIDFKALKISSADSNPDIGTPNKVIKFILAGNFYLVFVLVYYQEDSNGISFQKYKDSYTKTYLLKDVSNTFRRNPKNQLQVNMAAEPVYRSREKFIDILIQKLKESHDRQIEISQKALSELNTIHRELILQNKTSEKKYS